MQETTAKRVKEMGERLRNLKANYAEKLEMNKKQKNDAAVRDFLEKKGKIIKINGALKILCPCAVYISICLRLSTTVVVPRVPQGFLMFLLMAVMAK